jgi:ATP-dependent exoDNAse (exonuclease V) beta subunit
MTLDLTKYTIIKASAGSGKTYRLTQELANRLANGEGPAQLHPSEIIATTFTRKAAQELKHRIREYLVDENQLAQAAALPAALIGTVNSVTGRILQDFAVDIGLSPDLTVLTETAERRAFAIAADDIIATAEQEHRGLLARTGYNLTDADRTHFRDLRRNWSDTIRNVVNLARTNDIAPSEFAAFAEHSIQEIHSLISADEETDQRSHVLEVLRQVIQQIQQDLDNGVIKGRSVNPNERAVSAAARFVETIELDGIDSVAWKEWFEAAVGKFPGLRTPPAAFKKTLAALADPEALATDAQFQRDMTELVRLVFETAAQCMAAYREYKAELGLIDFIDQEHLTLKLLRTNPMVRETITERYRILAVDEFQDTSPLQLALFTELGGLVEEVIWVGDPKQSIYRFRGADPDLMQAAITAIEVGGGTTDTLSYSWRTHEVPLDVNNRIFSQLFAGIEPSSGRNPEVWLDVAPPRAQAHVGGQAQLWVDADNPKPTVADWYRRIVHGLIDQENSDETSGSRAILTRTNSQAADLQRLLTAHGIPVTGGGAPLLETREGAAVRAGIAFLLDSNDTQALVELIMLLNEHEAHESWLPKLTALETRAERRAQLAEWGKDPALTPLRNVREFIPDSTVVELTAAVIDALDLRTKVASWGRAREGTAALNGLLRAAALFTDEADAPIAADFLDFLEVSPDAVTQAAQDTNAVFVGTVHQSKGLEWDSVVVALPDGSEKFRPAGQWVHVTQDISMDAPLAGRQLRFWPETLLHSGALKKRIIEEPSQVQRSHAEQLEEQRLFYVAMTRSVHRTVLAPKTEVQKLQAFASGTVDLELTEEPTVAHLTISSTPEDQRIQDTISFDLKHISSEEEALEMLAEQRPPVADPPAARILVGRQQAAASEQIIPATFKASHRLPDETLLAEARVEKIADLGPALVPGGGMDWDRVGDCVHAYLAVPYRILDDAGKHRIAARLIKRWGVAKVLTPQLVIEAGNRWADWHDERYPAATVHTEVPFTWTSPNHQRTQGWLDQLTELSSGDYVVTDHKSYPGERPEQEILGAYTGQLQVYCEALRHSTGSYPTEVLVHLPLRGEVYAVDLPPGVDQQNAATLVSERH